jgi:hypothetical protein
MVIRSAVSPITSYLHDEVRSFYYKNQLTLVWLEKLKESFKNQPAISTKEQNLSNLFFQSVPLPSSYCVKDGTTSNM